jgi:hypothetical protein
MNRLFKFRAWDTRLNHFVSVFECLFFNNPEYIVTQFTGLYDKNNKEIYEGDILEYHGLLHGGGCYVEYSGQVKWGKSGFYLTSNHSFTDSNNWNILGNIFENKELLK